MRTLDMVPTRKDASRGMILTSVMHYTHLTCLSKMYVDNDVIERDPKWRTTITMLDHTYTIDSSSRKSIV